MEPDPTGRQDLRLVFEQHRRRLWGIAYRMLGSRAEADDLVQEADLRWHGSATAEIRAPEAWLVTAITRLAIDRLRQLRTSSCRVRTSTTGEPIMKPRIDVFHAAPKAVQAMFGLQNHVNHSGLEPALLTLVKMRASQLNGCAYCLDMHSKDARAEGESEQRLYVLDAWREAPFYTERERAALAWTEAVTRIGEDHVPDALYDATRQHFSEEELVNLTLAVIAINGWNRLSIAFRAEAGTYQPGAFKRGKTA